MGVWVCTGYLNTYHETWIYVNKAHEKKKLGTEMSRHCGSSDPCGSYGRTRRGRQSAQDVASAYASWWKTAYLLSVPHGSECLDTFARMFSFPCGVWGVFRHLLINQFLNATCRNLPILCCVDLSVYVCVCVLSIILCYDIFQL